MIIAISSEISVMRQIADTLGIDKRVVFIDTASNGQEGDKTWLDNQIGAIKKEYSNFDRYSIEGKSISDFQKDLKDYDIIHIGGGNTAYLLFHVLGTEFDVYLHEMHKTRIIIGSSAGGIMLGKSILHIEPLDDFSIVDLKNYDALGFFNFDIWVHFGTDKYRERYKNILELSYQNSQKGIYLSDDSYIISDNGKIEFCNV